MPHRPAPPPPRSRSVHLSAPRPAPAGATPGQAAVELVALLPLVAVVLAVGYQAVVAGEAVWQARVAARAAARAGAVGADPAAAARAHLPHGLEAGLRVHPQPEGGVRVSLRIPKVLPAISLGRATATAHFRPQT